MPRVTSKIQAINVIEKEGKPSNYFIDIDGYQGDLKRRQQEDLKQVLIMQMEEAKRKKVIERLKKEQEEKEEELRLMRERD
jgi:hypothetical protein